MFLLLVSVVSVDRERPFAAPNHAGGALPFCDVWQKLCYHQTVLSRYLPEGNFTSYFHGLKLPRMCAYLNKVQFSYFRDDL